mmetsp:Transcript_4645/g.10362  ORF Transcript_4645/g.10362 Transcript_4645/m.10362 type:complete len:96 (-) Transcript_4645:202-489(-)
MGQRAPLVMVFLEVGVLFLDILGIEAEVAAAVRMATVMVRTSRGEGESGGGEDEGCGEELHSCCLDGLQLIVPLVVRAIWLCDLCRGTNCETSPL